MPPWRNILGISAYYHDAAAALVCDGRITAAAQEERFTRKKNDADFPNHAIAACLRPRWFRGHCRFTLRLRFYTSQIFGKVVLAALFFLKLTPLGWALRLLGKDFIQLK